MSIPKHSVDCLAQLVFVHRTLHPIGGGGAEGVRRGRRVVETVWGARAHRVFRCDTRFISLTVQGSIIEQNRTRITVSWLRSLVVGAGLDGSMHITHNLGIAWCRHSELPCQHRHIPVQ